MSALQESLLGAVANPYPLYRRLRREDPVPALDPSQPASARLVTRYADVQQVLKDDVTFSNRSNSAGIGRVMGRTMIEMDGREHLRHRHLITPFLAPRALRGDFPERVGALADGLIDAFVARGEADLVPDFTFLYPLRVFTEILGTPGTDVARVHELAVRLTGLDADPEASLRASRELAAVLGPEVARARHAPRDDLIGRLVSAEIDGSRLSDEEVVSFLRLLVVAGAETSYHLIGSVLVALLTHPEELAAVRADPARLDRVIDETLRWESPVQWVTREVTETAKIGDLELPAGAQLIVAIGSANRDETVFAEPDAFRPDRDATAHVAFGFGRHYCAGSRLALLEARTALSALLERLPGLGPAPGAMPRVTGLAFRGPEHLHVRFQPAARARPREEGR